MSIDSSKSEFPIVDTHQDGKPINLEQNQHYEESKHETLSVLSSHHPSDIQTFVIEGDDDDEDDENDTSNNGTNNDKANGNKMDNDLQTLPSNNQSEPYETERIRDYDSSSIWSQLRKYLPFSINSKDNIRFDLLPDDSMHGIDLVEKRNKTGMNSNIDTNIDNNIDNNNDDDEIKMNKRVKDNSTETLNSTMITTPSALDSITGLLSTKKIFRLCMVYTSFCGVVMFIDEVFPLWAVSSIEKGN